VEPESNEGQSDIIDNNEATHTTGLKSESVPLSPKRDDEFQEEEQKEEEPVIEAE
jgi:hypothetical protein